MSTISREVWAGQCCGDNQYHDIMETLHRELLSTLAYESFSVELFGTLQSGLRFGGVP